MTEKQCSKCGEIKPFSEFHKDKKGTHGLRTWCKACEREYQRKYHKDNRKKVNENSHNYYHKHKKKRKEHKRPACRILKQHSEDLSDDPERLSTDFLINIISMKKEDCA